MQVTENFRSRCGAWAGCWKCVSASALAPKMSLIGPHRSHAQPQTSHRCSHWADLGHSPAHEAKPLGLRVKEKGPLMDREDLLQKEEIEAK